VKAFDKRDGSGAYNWGTPSDDLAASEEPGMSPVKDGEETPVDVDAEVTQDTELTPGEENKENVEAEVETLTYAEWKAKESETRKKPEFNLRKANEGEKLKGLKEYSGKSTDKDLEAKGSLYFPKKESVVSYKTSGRVKENLEFDIKYGAGENRHMDSEGGRRGGRGRGGRGRGRGRGGSDAPARNDSPVESGGFGGFGSTPTDEAGIQLEDTSEFPSLF